MKTTAPLSTFFDQWSRTYDSETLQALTYRPVHRLMLRWLSDADPSAVLDLGCGTGEFLRGLADAFPSARVTGLDLSTGMLSEAQTKVRNRGIGLVRGDAQDLPFSPNTFDVVICNESFHWYPDQGAALGQLSSVMRADGRLLIASIATTTDAGETAIHWLSRLGGQPLHALPPRRLAALLDRTGFDVIRQRRVPRLGFVPWPILTEAKRR